MARSPNGTNCVPQHQKRTTSGPQATCLAPPCFRTISRRVWRSSDYPARSLKWAGSEASALAGCRMNDDRLIPSPIVADRFRLFALEATSALGQEIAARLGCRLSAHEERSFEDGEHKARPLHTVRGAHVHVVQSLHSGPSESANDKLCRLLFFIGAIKDAGAATVTAVVPYLCYARKDRRTKPNDPVTTRYIAGMFEAVGTDCIVTLEVHNPVAFENAFRCRTVTLSGTPLFVEYLRELKDENFSVVSPDTGGAKR